MLPTLNTRSTKMLRRSIFNPLLAKVVAGASYTAIMQNYLTRLAAEGGSLTNAEKGYLNTLTLNPDITEFDRLWVHGLSNQIAARISLVNALTASLITEVNSPTFTSGQGYTGNGTTSYLDSNYNPSTQGVKYTLNSMSVGAGSATDVLIGTKTLIGCVSGADVVGVYPKWVGDAGKIISYTNNNSAFDLRSAAADPTTIGRYMVQRTASNLSTIYKNNVSLNTGAFASSSIPNNNLFILGINANGSFANGFDGRLNYSFAGSAAFNRASFDASITALGTSLGWT
jgi:hypothetical protein